MRVQSNSHLYTAADAGEEKKNDKAELNKQLASASTNGGGSEKNTSAKNDTSNSVLYGSNNTISADDIHQNGYNDCYFLSSLGEIAMKDPDFIRNMIKDNGDGTYTVTLYKKDNNILDPFGLAGDHFDRVTETVKMSTIDKDPQKAGQGASGGRWVQVVEAAYHQLVGSSLEGNTTFPPQAMEALTGHDAYSEYVLSQPSPGAEWQGQQQVKNDKYVGQTFSTFPDIQALPTSPANPFGKDVNSVTQAINAVLHPYGLDPNHTYMVVRTENINGQVYYILKNPLNNSTDPAPIPANVIRLLGGFDDFGFN